MEKLILKCGRYSPNAAGNVEQRIARIEAYLLMLSSDIEYLVGEMDRALEALEKAYVERDDLTALPVPTVNGEEEGV